MSAGIAFVIGIVIGWLVKWVFDRRAGQQAWDALEREEGLQSRVATLEAENKELKAAAEQQPQVIYTEKDDLERINGVGPVFARQFNEAGIHTFKDLASISRARARAIINPQSWQAIDPDSWIEQAQQQAVQQANGQLQTA